MLVFPSTHKKPVVFIKMKLLVFFICLVAVVAAAPFSSKNINYAPTSRINYSTQDVRLLKYENVVQPNGSYRYAWEQSDGSKAEQKGEIRNEGREDQYLAVSGSYSYIGPNNVVYTVTYTADEDGYEPELEEGPGPGISPDCFAACVG